MQTENTKNNFQKQAEEIVKKSHSKKVYFAIAIIFTAIAIGLFLGIVVIINDCKYLGSNKNIDFNLSDNNKIKNNQLNTSDWQTYQNEEFGFEMKYPEYWEKIINNNLIYFGNPKYQKGDNQTVVSIQIINEKSIREEIDKRKSELKAMGINALITESEVFVDNIKAKQIKLSYQSAAPFEILEIFTYLNYKNNLYTIYLSTDKSIEQEITDIYNQILSTFKFIEEETFSKNYNGFTVKGNDIYYGNTKAGFIEGDKINIFLKNSTLSFIGNLNKLEFFVNFSYNDLGISEGLYRANSTNSPLNITYKCDGPLRNLKNVKYEYCETNRKDYLNQYEFSDLTSSGFGTGGGTSWKWYKLYIKKINGADFVFQGYIDNNWINGPSIYYEEDKKKYKRLSTKEYLDGILSDQNIIDKINEWDKFIDSL